MAHVSSGSKINAFQLSGNKTVHFGIT